MINRLIKNLSNIPGWVTSRKIVVIESDDWGSVRMSSNHSREVLLKKGIDLDKGNGARYNRFDTLASKEDLEALFTVLTSVKDKNGNSAKITAVSLVANPDFDKIRNNGFTKYEYEPFTKTLERYEVSESFKLWKEGYSSGIFVPEFHGREHLNISTWMRSLQEGDKEAQLAFDHGIWGYQRKKGTGFQGAYYLQLKEDLALQKLVLSDGLHLFEKLHGRKARFFVPPNGFLNNQLERVANDSSIQYISTPKFQKEPLGGGKSKSNFRYLGKNNRFGQIYITRNAFFEPSGSSKDDVDRCLAEIENAFKWKKPAVISSHRVNYIGGLDINNRDKGLYMLMSLLKVIIKRWPDVEFLTSVELGDMITMRNDD